jgi:hypothetical protein
MRLHTLVLVMVAVTFSGSGAKAQATEAVQLALNYEKLQQLEKILDNMYKGYKILSTGYNRIKNIAEGNFNLHQVFLDALFAVNPSISKYKRIPAIINYQQLLMKEYKRAYTRFKNDPKLSAQEIKYLKSVYDYLVKQSLRNLEELTMIITATKLRMSDDERLLAIDRIYFDIEDKVSFLRHFNNTTQLLSIQRAKERGDASAIQKLYQIED